MKKVFIGLFALAMVLGLVYSGCGSDGGTKDGGSDAATDGGLPGDGGVPSDGGSGCTVVADSPVGKPCTKDTVATDCAGLKDPQCLDDDLCNSLTGSTGCDIPSGYCFNFDLSVTSSLNCGKGAWALVATDIDPTWPSATLCLKCCNSDDDCRKAEQYWCWKTPTGKGGCVPNDFHEILDKD
jgi:hypothetical protein